MRYLLNVIDCLRFPAETWWENGQGRELWGQLNKEIPLADVPFLYAIHDARRNNIIFVLLYQNVDHLEGDIGVPTHLVVLLRNMYANQKAPVKTEFGETEEFDIGKGVRQGCTSPLIFNIYPETIMRALDEWEGGIGIGGRVVTNLRYADDTTLIARTKEDLVEIMERVRKTSEKAGLYLNILKTKVMTTGDIGEVTVDGNIVEVITSFICLGALITREGLSNRDAQKNCNGKNCNRRVNNYMERQGNQGCHNIETGEGLGVPNSTVRSGHLDDEKSREEEN